MNHSRVKSNRRYRIDKVSRGFLGVRSMGLFAPLSYLRTEEDWGVGDLDALMMWVEFAKKAGVSLISLLPLNLPMDDNSPYSNVSAFVFDPVYIGMKMLLEYFDIPPNPNDSFSKIPPLVETLHAQGAGLNRRHNATNHETRELKYQVLRELFEGFQAVELQQDSSIVVDFPSRPMSDVELKHSGPRARAFMEFCLSQRGLVDSLLFAILARELKTDDFRKWPREIAVHSAEKIQHLKRTYKNELFFEFFVQWLLHVQLGCVREKCAEGEVTVDLMLDQPFAFGSADIWGNLDAFLIDPQTLKRRCTQGAPPHRLDIPQHWEFYALNMQTPSAQNLLSKRLAFYLQYCDFLRIDHLLGYYRLYCLTEDDDWEMTLEKMGIWDQVEAELNTPASPAEKRKAIYNVIVNGIQAGFPANIVARLFDRDGSLKPSNVILAARCAANGTREPEQFGWYSQGVTAQDQRFIYALLSPNDISETDFLEKIIREREMFLAPSDSIRVGFFEMGPGEEILSDFMQIAQEGGKTLVFENLGVVPEAVTRSLQELGASEFKPLIFGYQYFTGDHNEFWFDRLDSNSHVCFSTHDTITLRGWWEGKEKWAQKKYYFKTKEQKQAVIKYLTDQGYLTPDADVDLDRLNHELLRSVLASIADSIGRDAVIMMPNLFGSGDEGIINMPGHSGFWTARSPVTIEALLAQAKMPSNKVPVSPASRAVALLEDLVRLKERDSFRKQVDSLDPDRPHIICSHPMRRNGSKQIRYLGEEFMVDVVVYGKCEEAMVNFENGRTEKMQAVKVLAGLFPGLKVFRKYIPVDEALVGANRFSIALDGIPRPEAGYLIGLRPGTNLNPLADNYGRIELE